ncbi:MAG: hypothetical protein HY682_06345 [Chloroflexi bacterium]|nr:hypothetical protein [Chloroflexota bacterium]
MANVEEQFRALKEGAGILDRSGRSRVDQSGKDGLDLLHRLSTNELLDLGEGQARATIVTNGDGRIVDVITVVRRNGKRQLLLGSPGRGPTLVEWIDRYTFEEDSQLQDVTTATFQLTLAGPATRKVLGGVTGDGSALPPIGHGATARIGSADLEILHLGYPGPETFELIGQASHGDGVLSALESAGAVPVTEEAFDALRVETGSPEFGPDFDEQNNPHESGLVPLVSFTKGCYIGQEVVARLDTYDKVQRRIVKAQAEAPVESGATLLDGDRNVGAIRTVGPVDSGGAVHCLAMVRRGHWDPGTRLKTEEGVGVRVVTVVAPVPAAGG